MNFRPLSDLIFIRKERKERERGREREREREREIEEERNRERKVQTKEALTCDLPVDRMEKYGKIRFGSQS